MALPAKLALIWTAEEKYEAILGCSWWLLFYEEARIGHCSRRISHMFFFLSLAHRSICPRAGREAIPSLVPRLQTVCGDATRFSEKKIQDALLQCLSKTGYESRWAANSLALGLHSFQPTHFHSQRMLNFRGKKNTGKAWIHIRSPDPHLQA